MKLSLRIRDNYPTPTLDLLGEGQFGRWRFQWLLKHLWEECGTNVGEQGVLHPSSLLAHTFKWLCSSRRNTRAAGGDLY